MFASAPIAFAASVFAVRQERYGLASRAAFGLSVLELLFVVAIVTAILFF